MDNRTAIDRALIYDSTLREGTQCPGISLSVADKLRIAAELDRLGVAFIEGGMPDTNPKEDEFYRRIAEYPFKNAHFVPFGATARVGVKPENDPRLSALAETPFEYVCIYGKCDIFLVENVLRTDGDTNLALIADSVAFLKRSGKKVIFDCEGFFSGYERDREYALSCLRTAVQSGAAAAVLCDTTGIADPEKSAELTQLVCGEIARIAPGTLIGIHAHNDCGMADANTITAARNGATIVGTTLFGIGERCGGADFFVTVPNLQLRYGMECIGGEQLKELTGASYRLAELLNIKAPAYTPFVGRNAFSHKAGTHIDAVLKASGSFEPLDPALVGGTRRFLASEITGRSGMRDIVEKICGPDTSPELCEEILEALKQREFEGYQYESAGASLELLIRRLSGQYRPTFTLNSYKVITLDEMAGNPYSASAIVDLTVDGRSEITAGNGIGPVDALDCAFRRAMGHFYPCTLNISLVDYKVRVIDSGEGTASRVRVFIEFTNGARRFGTVGLSGDIIQASWYALVDAYDYWIMYNAEHDQTERGTAQ